MEENKPKGRARGRARGSVPSSQQITTPGGIHQGAGSQRQATRPGGMQERISQESSRHDLSSRMGAFKIEEKSSGGNGGNGDSGNGNGAPIGRGVSRGKREAPMSIVRTRPAKTDSSKSGGSGTPIQLVTNFFQLRKKKDWMLCLYHVDITPEEDRTSMKKKLMRQHHAVIGDEYIFDGMQLYCSKRFGKKVILLQSKNEETQSMFQLKVTFIKELGPLDSQFIQILNILLRRCQDHLGLQLMGRNYYNPKKEKEIMIQNELLRIWPGYTTSIRQYEDAILLNVDVTHKFLRKTTALTEMRTLYRQDKSFAGMLGSIVMTNYNDKTYRIDNIDTNVTPKSTFECKGTQKSYMDYYEQKYKLKILDPNQPLILSRPKARDIRRGDTKDIYLIPELCTMTGLTESIRSNRNTMRELSGFMKMSPDVRCNTLKQFNTDLFQNANVTKELNQWGLTLDRQLVEVTGRVVPEEKIFIGTKQFSYQRHISDWSRDIRSVPLNVAIQLKNWTFIYPQRSEGDAQALLKTLVRVAGPMGIAISEPCMVPLARDAVPDYTVKLKGCAGQQLVMCLLFNNNADKYNSIKKLCTIDLAIPSQCVLLRTARSKSLMSIASKIAIQINCKLGGEVWNLQIPVKSTMVIGYDAYHDSSRKGSSYGAVISSLNQNWTRYHGQVSRHSSKEELSNNFRVATKRALEAFINLNGVAPSNVVVFRDGVGDGQIAYVKDQEVEGIKKCIADMKLSCKLAFVIVSKRINTRIMLRTRNEIKNPPPGTVVDSGITLPERYDFFIVSQAVSEGTVSPTSYNVISDNTSLTPDHMQRIAYKLTHLYYNWQGTVRVPAPCLYAHKLAFITGQSIHHEPHAALSNKLWYL